MKAKPRYKSKNQKRFGYDVEMRTPSTRRSTKKRRTGKSQLNTGRYDLSDGKELHNEYHELLEGHDQLRHRTAMGTESGRREGNRF